MLLSFSMIIENHSGPVALRRNSILSGADRIWWQALRVPPRMQGREQLCLPPGSERGQRLPGAEGGMDETGGWMDVCTRRD